MLNIIKKHPLYSFLFRVFIVFILSLVSWILIIILYNNYKLEKSLQKKIYNSRTTSVELFKDINFNEKNKSYYKFVDFVKEQSQKEHTVLFQLYDEKKDLLFEQSIFDYPKVELDKTLNQLEHVSTKINHSIIPVSEDEVYFYYQDRLFIIDKYYYINILNKIDSTFIDDVKEEELLITLVVCLSFLILAIVLFPLIYNQYKSLLDTKNELIISNLSILTSLGNAISKKDSDTNEHNYRVTYYSVMIAKKMGLKINTIESLIKGSFLHDVGKIGIKDDILLKPAKLTQEEFEIMKTHVNHGVEIINETPWLEDAKKVILFHHEKVDGSGYPNGVKGNDIPIEARIFAVADVFDALSSKRPYKKAFSIHKSIDIIKNDTNTHFDKDIVAIFETIYKEIHNDISNKNTEELRKLLTEITNPYFLNE